MSESRSLERPYDGLTPEVILDAVESSGLLADGRLLALNSFENRVYQVGLEDMQPVVAKFYRPGRWSGEAIADEHQMSLILAERELPVVAPMRFAGESLLHYGGYRFALFPRQGGREPSLESASNLAWLGRLLGRIHAVSATLELKHRRRLLDAGRVREAASFLFDSEFVPFEMKGRYHHVTEALLQRIDTQYQDAADLPQFAIHGDCHRGNVLWTDDGPHFVDLDDCQIGPVVQDYWMLLDGDREQQAVQLRALLEGYEQFASFDRRQLALIEVLRAARMIEYAAWIARRWDDPAFPNSFPWFIQPRYWEDHIAALGEQIERVAEPALQIAD